MKIPAITRPASGNTGIVPPWLQHPIVILPMPEDEFAPLPGPDPEVRDVPMAPLWR